MNTQSKQSARLKQFKMWTLMAATLIVGVLLAFGRWAADDRTMMFGHVAWHAFPAGWVLAIEYGVLVLMVAAFIRADRVDALFSSTETLTWLGGICWFTAGLYTDYLGPMYGMFTFFLRKPSLYDLSLLLSAWPMAYGMIVVLTSVVPVMGWQRPFLRWRWILPAIFLVTVTTSWITLVFWPGNTRDASPCLGGSLIVLPTLAIMLSLVRDPERKLHWMNVIATVWISTALYFARFNGNGPVVGTMKVATVLLTHSSMLVLGDLLMLIGAVLMLLAKTESGAAGASSSQC